MELLYWFMKPASMSMPLTKYKSYSDFEDSFQHAFISLDNTATEEQCLLLTLSICL